MYEIVYFGLGFIINLLLLMNLHGHPNDWYLYEIVYFGLGFIMILLLLMNLHEIQMPVAWQIE